MGKNRSRLGKGWREWWEIKKSGWLYRGISPFRSKNKLGRERKSLIARFVGGLRSDIKEKVKAHPIVFLFDAIALAETIEEMNEEQSRKTPGIKITLVSKEILQRTYHHQRLRVQKVKKLNNHQVRTKWNIILPRKLQEIRIIGQTWGNDSGAFKQYTYQQLSFEKDPNYVRWRSTFWWERLWDIKQRRCQLSGSRRGSTTILCGATIAACT